MEVDLRCVFSLEQGSTDALDLFISHRLFEAGVWQSPRTSDGIVQLRIVESAPQRIRVSGRIYSIDQALHSFWLNIERASRGNAVSWALFFDVVAGSPRCEMNVIDLYDEASQIDWRVTLAGHGELRDGTLVVSSTASGTSPP
jgi:hypothetical protein